MAICTCNSKRVYWIRFSSWKSRWRSICTSNSFKKVGYKKTFHYYSHHHLRCSKSTAIPAWKWQTLQCFLKARCLHAANPDRIEDIPPRVCSSNLSPFHFSFNVRKQYLLVIPKILPMYRRKKKSREQCRWNCESQVHLAKTDMSCLESLIRPNGGKITFNHPWHCPGRTGKNYRLNPPRSAAVSVDHIELNGPCVCT